MCRCKITSKSLCKKAFEGTETAKEYEGGKGSERERERGRESEGGRESVRKTVREREREIDKQARTRGREYYLHAGMPACNKCMACTYGVSV